MAKDSGIHSVILWFDSTEEMLRDVLDVVPFEPKHHDMWSPKLVTVLLETCSQLDSLLKHQASQSRFVPKTNLTIQHYFQYFGEYFWPKWAVFWGEKVERIRPFDKWANLPAYKQRLYSGNELPWWTAYNKVKHNRIEHRREATLIRAVEAMAGLLLAILYCEECKPALSSSGWLTSPECDPVCVLDDHLNPIPSAFVVAETKLFAYPVGWMKEPIANNAYWDGPASARFRHWFCNQ